MNDQSHLPAHVAADSPTAIRNAKTSKGAAISALVPESLDDTFRLAKALSAAGDMVPKHFQGKPEATMAAIVRGMEIGLAPMQALSNIAVINGRASIWGDALPALMQRSGHSVDVVIEGEGEDMVATATLERGDTGKVYTRTFTWTDAKKAQLAGKQGPWQQYPKRMLSLRARSLVIRDGAADALMGMQVAEEVMDYQPMRDVTPKQATGAFGQAAARAKEQAKAKDEPEPQSEPETPADDQEGNDPNADLTPFALGQQAAAEGAMRNEYPFSDDDIDRVSEWMDGYDDVAGEVEPEERTGTDG